MGAKINYRSTDTPIKFPFLGLARCMLELVIKDLTKPKEMAKARLYIETNDWDYPLSFNNQCALLQLDPDYAREKVLNGSAQEILTRLKTLTTASNVDCRSSTK